MRKCQPFLIPLSEIDEIVEGSCVRDYGGAEDGPLVVAVRGRNFLECPVQVRREERSYSRDCRQLVVIEEDDTSRSDKMPEVEQVDEDTLEAMVAVDEREVEASPRKRASATCDSSTWCSTIFATRASSRNCSPQSENLVAW